MKGGGALLRMTGEGALLRMTEEEGALQRGGGRALLRMSSLSFRTAVRNLKSPSDRLPVPAMSWRVSRHLRFLTTFGMTKGEGAPRSEGGRVLFSVAGEGVLVRMTGEEGALQRGGGRGAPQNDGGGGCIPNAPRCHSERPSLSFRTAVRNLKSPSDGLPVPAMSWRASRHLRFLTTFGMTKGEGTPRSEGGRVLFSVTGEGALLRMTEEEGALRRGGGRGHLRMTGEGVSLRSPPLSFRTAVRNLKSPSDGQPVPAMSWRVSRHLRFLTTFGMTKGEGAPRSKGGGCSSAWRGKGRSSE